MMIQITSPCTESCLTASELTLKRNKPKRKIRESIKLYLWSIRRFAENFNKIQDQIKIIYKLNRDISDQYSVV